MLHSMTGFARQAVESPLGTLTWELRAVNHRYLDVQFKMPDELRPKEQEFRQKISEQLKRGKIECTFHFRPAFDESQEMQLNTKVVAMLASRIRELSATLPNTGNVNPVDVLRWPGVVQQIEIDAAPLFAEAATLLDSALVEISSMRRSEGERIAAMLETRCAVIDNIASSVRKRMPEVLEATRKKQRERVMNLDVDADPERLEVELALIAQKIDVDEELDRLHSHLTELRGTLNKDVPVGRRLDFLMQELNREANTLGSKSADTETTRAAVELKVLIEQMREQIQNIE